TSVAAALSCNWAVDRSSDRWTAAAASFETVLNCHRGLVSGRRSGLQARPRGDEGREDVVLANERHIAVGWIERQWTGSRFAHRKQIRHAANVVVVNVSLQVLD